MDDGACPEGDGDEKRRGTTPGDGGGQAALHARPYLWRVPKAHRARAAPRLSEAHQLPATVLGYWKSCSLSPCRRAKRCKGFLTEAQYEERYHRACPPCVGKSVERHAEIVKTLNALVERAKELQRAREEKGRK
ncbi:hypothetical protein [Rhizobium sp. BK376]|uniref:hypothetical protein n=1 Tax=Rhizobium sp. BK376 TaxID=2512149 RepID=UPI0010438D91|nr:hypothetical protein [Rhizobium sp. BK376]